MNGLNLHNIVANAISVAQEFEDIFVIKSNGVSNVKGVVTSIYDAPIAVKARIQTDSDQVLEHKQNIDMNKIAFKFYLATDFSKRVSGLDRLRYKTGDYLHRVADNTYFLVTALYDEFSQQGWVCIEGTLQIDIPPAVKDKINELS